MSKSTVSSLVLLFTVVTLSPVGVGTGAEPFEEAKASYWHHWRGPEANGVSRTANPPTEWSEEKNILWKVPIEGAGCSAPIIWDDKIFILTAMDTGKVDPSLPKPEDQPERVFGITHPNTSYEFIVLCLDRTSGKERWRRTATVKVPHEGHHRDNDFAPASPTTDGERLYCWFGSAGLFCYDLDGEPIWNRDLGEAYVGASLGEGCSPVVFGDKLVIVRDHSRQSNIEVVHAKTGKTLWKKDRDEPNAWATPLIVEHSGKTQIITTASKFVRSYDLNSGDIIWQCSGLTGNCIPAPVIEGDLVYCMSGYKGYSVMALPLNSMGDISETNKVVWSKERGTPYVPSPVLYDGMLYFLQSNQAIMTCLNAGTGEAIIDRTRLPYIGNVYSSPVAANGYVYVPGRRGQTLVIRRSEKLEIVATNRLDDTFDASPALAGNQLFLRGSRFLYCIAATR
jgi:outer membrane protein assembly factor BamB